MEPVKKEKYPKLKSNAKAEAKAKQKQEKLDVLANWKLQVSKSHVKRLEDKLKEGIERFEKSLLSSPSVLSKDSFESNSDSEDDLEEVVDQYSNLEATALKSRGPIVLPLSFSTITHRLEKEM